MWKRKLWDQRWMLWVLVSSIGLTQLATLSGWWTAEFGRQPWIVWQVLRTDGAESPNVTFAQVAFSHRHVRGALRRGASSCSSRLLNRKIKEGPPPPPDEEVTASLPDSFGEIFRRRSRVSSGGS